MPLTATLDDVKAYQQKVEKNKITPDDLPPYRKSVANRELAGNRSIILIALDTLLLMTYLVFFITVSSYWGAGCADKGSVSCSF